MNALEPLWKIEAELEALLDSIDLCPEELRGELEERIAQYLTAEVEKIDRVAGALASLEGVAANAKTEIARLTERRQAAEKAAERLKGYVLRVIESRDGRALKGRYVTFATRRSEALVIDDPALVPAEWKRTTVTVDVPKEPIRKALKEGAAIPGAHIEQRLNLVRK